MISKVFLLFATLLISTQMFSQDPNFHIYICFGQSNMEGSATIEEEDKFVDDRFKLMSSVDCTDLGRTKGNWYAAIPPLSQCSAGLAPSDYFGRTMVAMLPDSITIGLISVAVAGCDIRLFNKDIYMDYDSTYAEDWFTNRVKSYGGNPYKRIIELAELAKLQGVIKGIILHQGETNTGDEQWPQYVKTIYNDMLTDLSLKAEDVPLLAGEVVNADQKGKCASMNPIINKLPEVVPTAHVISSKECPERGDQLHFNSEGVRKLGRRYAVKMLSLEGVL